MRQCIWDNKFALSIKGTWKISFGNLFQCFDYKFNIASRLQSLPAKARHVLSIEAAVKQGNVPPDMCYCQAISVLSILEQSQPSSGQSSACRRLRKHKKCSIWVRWNRLRVGLNPPTCWWCCRSKYRAKAPPALCVQRRSQEEIQSERLAPFFKSLRSNSKISEEYPNQTNVVTLLKMVAMIQDGNSGQESAENKENDHTLFHPHLSTITYASYEGFSKFSHILPTSTTFFSLLKM